LPDSLCLHFAILHGARLAHDGDADLAGEAELRFDAFGDIPCHQLSSGVVDLLRFDQDPNLAAGLDGVRLLDARERVGDLFELFEPLHVSLERFPARPWARSRDRVRGYQQERLDGVRFLVVVVCTHGVHDLSRNPVPLEQIRPDHRMRALDLVVDGLADVVEQA